MGPRRGALARLCVVSSACALLCAVPSHAAAPLAPHLAITVPKNGEVVIKLLGYDTDGGGLTATITTLPSAGALFQVTQIFSDYGYSPKRGVPIAAGAAVTGSSNQMIYTPPWNTNPPLGKVCARRARASGAQCVLHLLHILFCVPAPLVCAAAAAARSSACCRERRARGRRSSRRRRHR
jgi:hypothetical protein